MILSGTFFLPSDKHPLLYSLVQDYKQQILSILGGGLQILLPFLPLNYYEDILEYRILASCIIKDVIPLFHVLFFSAEKLTFKGVFFIF